MCKSGNIPWPGLNLWSPETRAFFFHGAGGVWMHLPHTNLRNRGVEARNLEIGVGRGRTVSLHRNKPWRRNLMGVLQRERDRYSQHSCVRNGDHQGKKRMTKVCSCMRMQFENSRTSGSPHLQHPLLDKVHQVLKRVGTMEKGTICFSSPNQITAPKTPCSVASWSISSEQLHSDLT